MKEFLKKNPFILPVLVAILIWGLGWVAIYSSGHELKLGQIGDAFGAVNALFSGIAFIGLYLTVKMQQKQLDNYEIEIANQRIEQEAYRKLNDLRGFESMFFQLLEFQSDIVNSIDLKGAKEHYGHDCFKLFYSTHFREAIEKYIMEYKGIKWETGRPNPHPKDVKLDINEILIAYQKFFMPNHDNDLGHYFRHLYHIVRFVDEAEMTHQQKYKYIRLVRAQLSTYEQLLIFYNCLSIYGKDKFKPLIERYALFKNLNTDLLLDGNHKMSYTNDAYVNIYK